MAGKAEGQRILLCWCLLSEILLGIWGELILQDNACSFCCHKKKKKDLLTTFIASCTVLETEVDWHGSVKYKSFFSISCIFSLFLKLFHFNQSCKTKTKKKKLTQRGTKFIKVKICIYEHSRLKKKEKKGRKEKELGKFKWIKYLTEGKKYNITKLASVFVS